MLSDDGGGRGANGVKGSMLLTIVRLISEQGAFPLALCSRGSECSAYSSTD